MAAANASTLDFACRRRFPAWTLYARALSGNRAHADYFVEKALAGARKRSAASDTEAQVHALVLSSIRSHALRPTELPSTTPAAKRSILGLLHEPGPGELERAKREAAKRFSALPRAWRESIDRVLLRRPSWTLEKLAAHDVVAPRDVAADIENGIRAVAASLLPVGSDLRESPGGGERHSALETLLAYVHGALTADEAHEVVSHGRACVACGNRLGTMMLLRAASVEGLRVPLLPRAHRRAARALLVVLSLGAGLFLLREAWPNPWKEHASHETVPRWFYEFLYRSQDPRRQSDIARGLSLLVEGKYEEAIATLEPLSQGSSPDTDATTYLGIARYLSGDTSRRTVRLLESGTSSPTVGRLARWYLASVLLSRGDLEGARSHLRALEELRDWFGRAAEALLEKIEEARKPAGTLAAEVPAGSCST
jgi:hypothetical protein